MLSKTKKVCSRTTPQSGFLEQCDGPKSHFKPVLMFSLFAATGSSRTLSRLIESVSGSLKVSIAQLLIGVAVCIGGIFWFTPGSVGIPNTTIGNDHMHWPKLERLISKEDYIEWDRSIPDGTAWTREYTPPTSFPVNFSTTDLAICPLDSHESRYPSYASRLQGRVTFLIGKRYESGPSAIEVSLPKNSLLYFKDRHIVCLIDFALLAALAFAGWAMARLCRGRIAG